MKAFAFVGLSWFLLSGFQSNCQVSTTFGDRLISEFNSRLYPDCRKWLNNSLVIARDGSRFFGALISEESKYLLFRLNTSDTVKVDYDFIEKYYRPGEILVFNRGKFHPNKGLFATISIGFAASSSFTGQINGNIGYRFGNRYAAGVGIGYESHETYYGGLYLWDDFCSLYGFGRYYLTNSKKRWYSDFKAGYGISVNDWMDERSTGGLLIQPGLGIIFPSKKSIRIFASVSQVFQYSRGVSNEFGFFGSPIIADYKVWFNRTVITAGFEIK
jgi:hypothetical protein